MLSLTEKKAAGLGEKLKIGTILREKKKRKYFQRLSVNFAIFSDTSLPGRITGTDTASARKTFAQKKTSLPFAVRHAMHALCKEKGGPSCLPFPAGTGF